MVLTTTHNLCFEQKYEKDIEFLSENFQFLVVKFTIYLNRHVFVMTAASVNCHMVAIKSLPVLHHRAFFIFFGIIEPILEGPVPLEPVLGFMCDPENHNVVI